MLSVGPEVGVVPGKLVESGAAERCSHDGFIRVQKFEYGEYFFRFWLRH
jgi:hypothetical protein